MDILSKLSKLFNSQENEHEIEEAEIASVLPVVVEAFNIRNQNKKLAVVRVHGEVIGVVVGETLLEAQTKAQAHAAFRGDGVVAQA